MKRDLDLFRAILLHVEDVTDINTDMRDFGNLGALYNEEDILGHFKLLFDAHYIQGKFSSGTGGYHNLSVRRLTNEGHDYLDSVRDPKIWKATKVNLAKVGGATTLALVQDVASSVATKLLGLN